MTPEGARFGQRARGLAVLCFATALLGVFPAAASASRQLMRGMWEERYYSSNPQVRAHWLDETVQVGATFIRIGVPWREIAGEQPPANPRDPMDSSYGFELTDALVREASARGLDVLLTVERAPRWAEGKKRPGWAPQGTWKPSPTAFGAFGEALARRYSGEFATSAGPLPRVEYIEAWNEPNQNAFLSPQWRRKRPFAPDHYRRMLNAFYRGVRRSGTGAKVLGPATSPYGDPSHHGSRMRPMLFMRELLCMRGRRNPQPARCVSPARLDILSHHPINLLAGPRASADHPDDAVVGDMSRILRLLRAAERARNVLPAGRRPLWATEIWWLTDPPSANGFPPRTQARWVQQAFYLLWKQRVQAVVWYQLTDAGGFPSGLFFANGTPKPGLTAFRFPFVTEPRRGRRALAWGIAPASGTLRIQRRKRSGWRIVESVEATAGETFRAVLRLQGSARLRAEVAGMRSLTWVQTRSRAR